MAGRVLGTLLVGTLLWIAPLEAADTLVLIDRSGSMRPYYESGLVHDLARRIIGASEPEGPDLGAFDTSWEHIGSVDTLQYTRRDTNLGLVVDEVVKQYRRVWILTDNVQDMGGSHDMREFYGTLRSEHVRHVYIFPFRQQPGSAGLLIYAMSTEDDPGPLQTQVASLRRRVNDLDVSELLMKPLGANSITVEMVGTAPSMEFREGDRLTVEAVIRITARSPHLYFESSPAQGTEARSPFVGESCLFSEKGETNIDPARVQTSTAGEYHIRVDFGRVRLKRTLPCIWAAAFERSAETKSIEAPSVIDVAKASLRLSSAFLDEFAATTPQDAITTGKIFGVQDVPAFLAPESTRIPIQIPQTVIVRYPAWPAFLLMGLAGLVGGAVIGLMFSVHPKSWFRSSVRAETPSGESLPAVRHGDRIYVNGQSVGRVEFDYFIPDEGVRLGSGDFSAPIGSPVSCVLSDDTEVVLFFGRVAARRPETPGDARVIDVDLERR